MAGIYQQPATPQPGVYQPGVYQNGIFGGPAGGNGTDQFNLNPTPQAGSGAYGAVPGKLGLPNSLYSEVQGVAPALPGLTGGASSDISSYLSGQLAPGTIQNLQDQSAEFGVASGMPGSGLQSNNLVKSLGLTSEGLTQQGVGDYLNFLGGVGASQVSPELQASIAEQNAVDASAPNPAAAAATQLQLYQEMMQRMNPSGGSTPINPAPFGGNYFTPAGTDQPMPLSEAYS